MSVIKFVITGGTIDKLYNELDGSLTFTESHIPAMLKQARCNVDLSTETVMLKDSLDMDDADRELISKKCESCDESKIIISHGTDTMVETAAVLAEKISGKTIVLFGAMIPFSITNSDSLFNLGCAVAAVQCLEEGVFISMNGKIFPGMMSGKIKLKVFFKRRKNNDHSYFLASSQSASISSRVASSGVLLLRAKPDSI